jgi:hypothetical protein
MTYPAKRSLSATAAGDVFYLAGDPSRVWHRYAPAGEEDHWDEGYEFAGPGSDVYFRLEDFGRPGQEVIVIHNTKDNPQGEPHDPRS